MKRAISILAVLALVFIGTAVCEAQSKSQSFRLAVHIPAIAGVNVPLDDPNAEIYPAQGLQLQNAFMDIRQLWRGTEEIVMQTVLVR